MTEMAALNGIEEALSDYRKGQVVGYVDQRDPLSAEIVPGAIPRWYVLETLPNHERIVASHLIAHRFGMFVPESEICEVRRGRKVDVTRLMFPGYVFVFVWDIVRHARRLYATPGVAGILCWMNSKGEREPLVVDDRVIDKIRAVENRERPLPAEFFVEDIVPLAVSKRKKKKNRWRRKNKPKQSDTFEVIACRPWDAFQDAIATLDSDGRNGALRHALGLSS